MRERLSRSIAGALLAGVAVMASARALGLARHGASLDAHGERAWFAWALQSPSVRPLLERAAGELRPGEAVWIAVLDPSLDPGWVRVMALYSLSGQCVVGAGREAPASRITRVELLPGARVRVVHRTG
ncbi:MAG: hypothetical protein M3S32_03100 [Acidobacteriota bacterium]|nr:hypothetical protein [Acidobacteriota bacterium]